MGTEYEERLRTRARALADLYDIRQDTLACLGAARHAGLDPDALTGLVGCAAALGANSIETYTAGDGWTGRHASERHFLGHVASIEDDIEDRYIYAGRLDTETGTALETAREDRERRPRPARPRAHPARRRPGDADVPALRRLPRPPGGGDRRRRGGDRRGPAADRRMPEADRDLRGRRPRCEAAGQPQSALGRIRAVPGRPRRHV